MDINNLVEYFKNDTDVPETILTKLNINETENINKLNKFNNIFEDYVLRYGV